MMTGFGKMLLGYKNVCGSYNELLGQKNAISNMSATTTLENSRKAFSDVHAKWKNAWWIDFETSQFNSVVATFSRWPSKTCHEIVRHRLKHRFRNGVHNTNHMIDIVAARKARFHSKFSQIHLYFHSAFFPRRIWLVRSMCCVRLLYCLLAA